MRLSSKTLLIHHRSQQKASSTVQHNNKFFELQRLAAPEWVFEAIPQLEFDWTANLAAEAGYDQWTHPAGTDAEPIPELEFDQTLGL